MTTIDSFSTLQIIFSFTGDVEHDLWVPKHMKRGYKDLHELDICLSIYDRALTETM